MVPGTLEVIVPAHDAGRFLAATLQSVVLQHVLPQAVTVVDDRSADDTAAVAIACAADYAEFLPIRLLHNTGRPGPSAARNLAIRRSTAEFIALLDAGAFGTSACIIRRQAALDVGLFDESLGFGEDTDLFLRLAMIGRFAFTRATVMHKREHDSNLTHSRNAPEFDRAKVLSLTRLLAEADSLRLTAAEKDALDAELARAVDAYTYHASRRGPVGYGDAMRLAREAGRPTIPLKPRHLARLMLRGMAARDRVA